MDSFGSASSGGGKDGSRDGRDDDGQRSKSKNRNIVGWNIGLSSSSNSSHDWKSKAANQSFGHESHSNWFNSGSKYNHPDTDYDSKDGRRSESMREELTRSYLKPPPNRVVHCCSFPCLCSPGQDGSGDKKMSKKSSNQLPQPNDDQRNSRSSGNWFNKFSVSSTSSSAAQEDNSYQSSKRRGSKDDHQHKSSSWYENNTNNNHWTWSWLWTLVYKVKTWQNLIKSNHHNHKSAIVSGNETTELITDRVKRNVYKTTF